MTTPHIGWYIRARREHLGYTQRDAAHRAGMQQTMLSRIEIGKQEPTRETLDRIAEALDCHIVDNGYSLIPNAE